MALKSIEMDTTNTKGADDGYAELDSDGKVPIAQLPPIIKRETHIVLVHSESGTAFSS